MKIAVVGSGVAGLGAAWALNRAHDIVVYEAESRLGGHANTLDVEVAGQPIAVDTGFIVYNELNYPNLTRLFELLQVPTEPSDMSFSASIGPGCFEYQGSWRGLLAQRRNIASPRFWRMILGILRFYRQAPDFLNDAAARQLSLGDYLAREGFSGPFVDDHLLPMGAAIWSTPVQGMLDFPACSFIQFCDNHGLMLLTGRPQWRTVSGGSREYVARVSDSFKDKVRLNCAAVALRRTPAGILLRDAQGQETRFDQVVLACHADQALALLGNSASALERNLLSAFDYLPNRALLHQDDALMPRRRAAWASWNYMAEPSDAPTRRVSLTYWMNRLQNIDPSLPLFLSLNPLREPDPAEVLADLTYRHPLFDGDALDAQEMLPTIQGQDRVWFCGSYCGYGFHEDGLQAGLTVAAELGAPAPWADGITPKSPAAANARPEVLPIAAQ